MVGSPLVFHPRVGRDTKMRAIAEQHLSLLERKMMSIFMDNTDHVEAKDSKDAVGNANGNGCRDFPVLHRVAEHHARPCHYHVLGNQVRI